MTSTLGSGLWPLLTSLRSRFGLRFSASGRSAAGLYTDGRGTLLAEYWDVADRHCREIPGFSLSTAEADEQGMPTTVVPFDDGSVLIVSPSALTQLDGTGHRTVTGPLPFRADLAAPAPDGSRRVLFLGRTGDQDGECVAAVWANGSATVLGTLPPLLLRGGGWFDRAGTRFVVNRRSGGPAIWHLGDGRLTGLPEGQLAWLTAPGTGQVLLSSAVAGTHHLRWHRQGTTTTLHAPRQLTGSVTPLAMRPRGGAVALHVSDGLQDEIAVLDLTTDTVRRLPGPPRRALGATAWGTGGIHTLAVGAAHPARMVVFEPDGWAEITDGTEAGGHDGWAKSELLPFPGAEGEIEAVVCGHEDWRTAREVVIALHGGPKDRWSLKFSQLFQLFAEAGITVIAPNPRGSTGYGEDFHRVIVGAWGGPDLEDVLVLGAHVQRERRGRPSVLHGSSYGAYLALLSATATPEPWSRVVAIAPMLSASRLYPGASPEIQAMIDRLGGRRELRDHRGSRDLLDRVPALHAPLLLVHGGRDDRIPVAQSRLLAGRLRDREDFRYLEVPGAGHTPLDGSAALHQTVVSFAATGELPTPEFDPDPHRRR